MDLAFQVTALLVWIPLSVLVISAMLRGDYRRYPLIFAYVVVDLLSTVAAIPAYWAVYVHRATPAEDLQNLVYWLGEVVAQVLIYAVVIDLIYRASRRLASGRAIRIGVTAGAVIFAAATFAICYTPGVKLGAWMTPWTRDLNFCAAILDVALWGLLIASREKDQRVLLLSGALGIQFTGQAIGESLRQLAIAHHQHWLAQIGGELGVVADILRTYIWWRVFRTAEAPASSRSVPAGVTPGPAPQK